MPAGVDWERAARWAGRLAPPGPTGTRADLERLVADLRNAAERARPLALRAARLTGAVEASGRSEQQAKVLVVDRPGWAGAAVQSFAALAEGASDAAQPGRSASGPGAAGGPAATAQVAGLVAVLSGRVLGQFDPFGGADPGGRLLLVAPNVLRVGRAIGADPADFHLWVCVHEQTHALQFAAAPWLAEHLRSLTAELVAGLAAASPAAEVAGALGGAIRALRGTGRGGGGHDQADGTGDLGVLDAVLDADQRELVARITAVMSLLEGHADVAMDAVPRAAIPSARRLRTRFEARRDATGFDAVLRRLLGLDAKLAQYRRGALFVREVRRVGGPRALDAAWTGPEHLPRPAEIADAAAWVRRVDG